MTADPTLTPFKVTMTPAEALPLTVPDSVYVGAVLAAAEKLRSLTGAEVTMAARLTGLNT